MGTRPGPPRPPSYSVPSYGFGSFKPKPHRPSTYPQSSHSSTSPGSSLARKPTSSHSVSNNTSLSSSRASTPNVTDTKSQPPQQSALPGTSNAVVDVYRPIANQVKKAIQPLLPPSTITNTPDLNIVLGVDSSTYASRISGKTVLLTDIPTTSSKSTPTSSLAPGQTSSGPSSFQVPWGGGGGILGKGEGTEMDQIRLGTGIGVGQMSEAGPSRARSQGQWQLLGKRKSRKSKEGGSAVIQAKMKIEYSALLPLHYMHSTYLIQLLALPPLPPLTTPDSSLPPLPLSAESIQSRLVKADLTGSRLTVRAARNASLIGLTGIVIEETAGSFRLVIAKDNTVRVVPKLGSLFTLSFPAYAPKRIKVGDVYDRIVPQRQEEKGDGMNVDHENKDDGSSKTMHIAGSTVDEAEDDGSWLDWPTHDSTCPRIEVDILGSAFAFRSADRAGRRFKQAQGVPGSGWGEDWVGGEWQGVLDDCGAKKNERVTAQSRAGGRRKRGKSRRKDPLAGGSLTAFS